ncbi:MAG: CRISPR-associated endonuclease Cas2, partial [Sulfurospirillum sp.]|nr:CRISPR-associated endonuclease Cas2 [Sulfurospirillum sp.]
MNSYESRFMRLIVLFDLPTSSKKHRREATKFRNYILSLGFMMLQYSIYVRVCKGQDIVDKYLNKVMQNLPSSGNVRVLQITEKQYGRMEILVGKETKEEQKITKSQL